MDRKAKRAVAIGASLGLAIAGAVMLFVVSAFGLASSFPRGLANVLVSEGGNDDDPHDPGGRTSRGVIQREWNVWRKTHGGLPADVWNAPQGQIEAIYHQKYWQHPCVRGDALPAGLDYVMFDEGVSAGVQRAGKVLRWVLKLPQDGCTVTAAVLKALARNAVPAIIKAFDAESLAYRRRLSACRYYCTGWANRIHARDAVGLRMAGAPAPTNLFGEEYEPKPAFGPGKAWVR